MSSDDFARAFAAVAQVPQALAAVSERLGVLEAEVRTLRGALPPVLVTMAEASRRLGVSLSTVRRRLKDGTLPCRRVGRVVRVDLSAVRPPFGAEVVRLAFDARLPR